MRPSRWRLAFGLVEQVTAGLALAIAGFVAFSLLKERQVGFAVEATTETVEVQIVDESINAWDLPNATTFDARSRRPIATHDQPRLVVAAGTCVTARRLGYGILELRLEQPDRKTSAGRMETAAEEDVLPPFVVLETSTAREAGGEPYPIVLPFGGSMWLGEDIAEGVSAMLLGGQVKLLEAVWPGDRYLARTEDLLAGDRLDLPFAQSCCSSDSAPGDVPVRGFLRVEPEILHGDPAIRVVASIAATEVRIVRMQSAPLRISQSPWTPLSNDALLAGLLVVLGALATLLTVLQTFTVNGEKPVDQPSPTSGSLDERAP